MIIGIDLGTTNSLGAAFIDGESVLIPNEYGDFLTPSVVSLSDDNCIIVGKAAKERLVSNPQKTAQLFKRTMGTEKTYKLGNKEYSSEELSAFILQSIKKDAEAFLKEEVTEAIISVPAYFDDARREATKRAGIIAGLKVERIINEPSAAALACRMEKRKEVVINTLTTMLFDSADNADTEVYDDDQIYMIFDFGGGTLDVSLVECFENVISITAVSGNNHLGGSDIDKQIAREFCSIHNINYDQLNNHEYSMILKQAEKSKIALTDCSEYIMRVVINGEEKQLELTQEKLIKICATVLKQLLIPISKVMMDSQTTIEMINEIVLIGGSSKMPIIAKYLESRTGKKPITIGSPDTMVAQGLGIYAGMKERKEEIKDMVMTDICPFTLGISTYNESNQSKDYMSPIIERNTVLPCTKSNIYTPVHLEQKCIEIRIYQGEAMYVDENTFLGNITVKLPKKTGKLEEVEVKMTYDINGILEVEATILSTGEKCQSYIIKQGGLSEKEIAERKERLEQIKKEESENAKGKLVLERANSLYQMINGPLRDQLSYYVHMYNNTIESGTPLSIKRSTNFMEQYLDKLEKSLDQYGLLEESIEIDEDDF